MSLPFKTLEEFIEKRDGNEIALTQPCGAAEELNYDLLVAVLKKNYFLRVSAAKKWLKQVGGRCGVKVRLKVSLSAHKPYMRESGEVCLSFKDFNKPSYTLFAIAHETAHFILMTDEDYGLLKALDAEYPGDAADRAVRSPVEYCANLVTLFILEKCAAAAKRDRQRQKISRFISDLREQSVAKP